MPTDKLNHLREILRSYGSCLVAYSGGVDSTFLASVAQDVLGTKALAVIADSPSLPRRELEEALEAANQFQIAVRVIKTEELDDPRYASNPVDRCYFCKHELFAHLVPLAQKEGFAVIAYGENASDLAALRPGSKAAADFQIRAPLKEAGLEKAEIRELSAQMGLPTAQKPALACLSSRIPHGEPVTTEKLKMIEEAEYVLRDLGCYDVRVRHHEFGGASGSARCLARIELGPTEEALKPAQMKAVLEALKKLGYTFVTLDLEGYRSGNVKAQPLTAQP